MQTHKKIIYHLHTTSAPIRGKLASSLYVTLNISLIYGGGGGGGEGVFFHAYFFPFLLSFFFLFFEVNHFRMILCNRHKDVHVLWVWSDVAPSTKIFRPPLSEFSGSALSTVKFRK